MVQRKSVLARPYTLRCSSSSSSAAKRLAAFSAFWPGAPARRRSPSAFEGDVSSLSEAEEEEESADETSGESSESEESAGDSCGCAGFWAWSAPPKREKSWVGGAERRGISCCEMGPRGKGGGREGRAREKGGRAVRALNMVASRSARNPLQRNDESFSRAYVKSWGTSDEKMEVKEARQPLRLRGRTSRTARRSQTTTCSTFSLFKSVLLA